MSFEARAPVDRWLREESVGLSALARGLLGRSADADDCVQDAWVAALRSPEPENPPAWLRGVVRRLAARRWRAAARRGRRERIAARGEATPSTADVAARLDVRRRVLAAVTALDEPYRTAIVLRYFEERSPASIARLQGVPVATVKTRLHRALALLRGALDAAHGGDRRAWAIGLLTTTFPTAAPLGGAALALGGLLAMKKAIAAAALLVAVLGLTLWLARDRKIARDDVASTAAPEAASPRLEGAAPPVPAATATAPRDDAALPAATFSGRVVDGEGRPVPGARVDLVWYGAHPDSKEAANALHLVLRRDRERREGPTTVTDPDGRFRFDRPYASSSFLVAAKEGLSTAVSGPHASGSSVVITMAPERALRVVVETPDDRPLQGADVRLVTPLDDLGLRPRQVLAAARTGPDGSARLPIPVEGGLRLEVAPAQAEWGVVDRPVTSNEADVRVRVPAVRVVERRILDAETGDPAAGAWVEVHRSASGWARVSQGTTSRRFPADRDGVVRFPWQEDHYRAYATAPGYEVVDAWEDPIRLPRSFEIEGVVTTSSGAPVAGAAVFVVIPPGNVFADADAGLPPIAAWSDSAGTFRLEVKLPHGAVAPQPDRGVRSVLAVHPDHVPAIVDDVVVRPGGRSRVTLRFPRPASLEISLVDATGAPVANAWVSVGRRIPRAATWQQVGPDFGVDAVAFLRSVSYETGPDGRITRDGLPPGEYVVTAGPLVDRVDLSEGETRRVRLTRGLGRFIAGRVVDARGSPIANATVGLLNTKVTSLLLPVKTGADGRFRFDDLPAHEYEQVSVQTPTGFFVERRPIRSGDDLVLRVPDPARLRLVVEGLPRGTSVEYAVRTFSGGFVGHGDAYRDFLAPETDTPPFTPGDGILVVRAGGYGWTAVRISAPEGSTTPVAVSLARAGSVEGHVRDPSLGERGLVRLRRIDDRPPHERPASIVAAYGITLPELAYRSPAADGTFRFEELNSGPYELSYGRIEDRVWHAVATERVDVASGETVARDLGR
jgi:RNA polymerase sigma-70 factor (ECF subfamily)